MSTKIIRGDCRDVLSSLPADSVHCVVTSPPYWGLRDYGVAGQLGLEPTPAEYLAAMVAVFSEVHRVLRPDGVLFLNMGDSYNNFRSQMGPGHGVHGRDKLNGKPAPYSRKRGSATLKEKDLVGMPWRLAFALQSDGWYLRSDIIWHKPNPMPESVRDRPTKAHEYVFLLTKSAQYFWDQDAVKEPATERAPGNKTRHKHDDGTTLNRTKAGLAAVGAVAGRNIRTVWTIATSPFAEAHFATFPPALAERCIKAGTSERGCCPACGAPWVRVVVVDRDDRVFMREQTVAQTSGASHRTINGVVPSFRSPKSNTTGFRPSCDCPPADPVPCTVLDCFSGAGTTGLVADRLGRDAILIELNEDYAEMAAQRLRGDGGMFARVDLANGEASSAGGN